MLDFPTEYGQILDRIDQIDPRAYSKSRNFLNGKVTFISPYLTHGVVTLEQVKNTVLERYSFEESEKLIFELAWKEYFQRVWENAEDRIFEDFKRNQEDVVSRDIPFALINAQTGIEALDNQINLLFQTGYMHNHARMWLASVTCNLGKFHWFLPAKWLYFHLLDGDLASNSLSWQWVAGTFSSKKYWANQDNLNKYSGIMQSGTFLDHDYVDLPNIDRPKELSAEIGESELRLTTDLSVSNLKEMTNLPILTAEDLTWPAGSSVAMYHPWCLNPRLDLSGDKRILLLAPTFFINWPISSKRLRFILDLAKNIMDLSIFVGEVEDLQDFAINSQDYPLLRGWKSILPNLNLASRSYMFPQADKLYPSFFAFWNSAVKKHELVKNNKNRKKYH